MVVGDFIAGTDVLVIGGGPGGYTAAIRAAQLGQEVTLIEKKALGGICLNEGCIPSKALISAAEDYHKLSKMAARGIEVGQATLNFSKFQEWKNKQVVSRLSGGIAALCKSNNVNVMEGEAYFTDKNEVRVISDYASQRIRFGHCIIATGSRPIEISTLPFGGRILSSTEALSLDEIPGSMIVVGGGYIGIELGTAFAKFGTKVTIIEATSSILPGFDIEMSRILKKNLKKLGVHIHTVATVIRNEAAEHNVTITAHMEEQEEMFQADYCLVTVGRRPNTEHLGLKEIGIRVDDKGLIQINEQCRTSVPHIYAVGDVVPGPALAHKASYEGKVAAEAIANLHSAIDYVGLPAVIFSDPEIATVGLDENQAKEQGYQVKVGKFPFSANGRALTSDETEGFTKIVADEDERVLGVQIIGSQASNMISGAVLAMEMGAKVEDISLTIHPHPTLAEGILEASESLLKKAIHMVNS
jgi:dihydrolipoamide dehydrogenase